jgi:hypothetical protein
MAMYSTQDHGVYGLRPSSGILNNQKTQPFGTKSIVIVIIIIIIIITIITIDSITKISTTTYPSDSLSENVDVPYSSAAK